MHVHFKIYAKNGVKTSPLCRRRNCGGFGSDTKIKKSPSTHMLNFWFFYTTRPIDISTDTEKCRKIRKKQIHTKQWGKVQDFWQMKIFCGGFFAIYIFSQKNKFSISYKYRAYKPFTIATGPFICGRRGVKSILYTHRYTVLSHLFCPRFSKKNDKITRKTPNNIFLKSFKNLIIKQKFTPNSCFLQMFFKNWK